MIRSFADRRTKDIYNGVSSKEARKFPRELHASARRKLDLIHRAGNLEDLKVPPGNRLHALRDNLSGFHSISINDQWRIIFLWNEGDAHEVKITDYH
jgi:proteic killer suppression protein